MTAEIGWWMTQCCGEDLRQIEDEEDLDDFFEDQKELGHLGPRAWPTRERALVAIEALSEDSDSFDD